METFRQNQPQKKEKAKFFSRRLLEEKNEEIFHEEGGWKEKAARGPGATKDSGSR